MDSKEQEKDGLNNPKKDDIKPRTLTRIIIEILLRPEQISEYKIDIEKLQKKYANID
jgi:hypothetical protein